MARATTPTLLPLDRWAAIIGLNPLHFNQLSSNTLMPNTVCGDVWFQHAWQHSDRLGREDIAMAIKAAEEEIIAEVGYNLIPDWTIQERIRYAEPALPEAYNLGNRNPRYQNRSVETRKGMMISGGVRASTLLEEGAAVTRSSEIDTEAYKETATVVVAVTTTDTNEIRVYYPGKNGQDSWEIRPLDSVEISGGFATIKFKSWLIVAANQMENINPDAIDADDDANYETTVDVYRVYNDPQTQVEFLWELDGPGLQPCGTSTCQACQFGTQSGCFHTREQRLGTIVPAYGTWDSDDENFDVAYPAVCRGPDQVNVWYYSGHRDWSLDRPSVQMSPYWEYAVAYYAASKLERPVCGCSNVNQFIEIWRTDKSFSDDAGSFIVTPEMLANKFGTKAGALYAYKRVHQNGMRINK